MYGSDIGKYLNRQYAEDAVNDDYGYEDIFDWQGFPDS
jgi:hypothetical protein